MRAGRASPRIAALALFLATAAGAASAPAVADAPAPATVDAPAPAPTPSAEAGRRAYTTYCVRCHGINLVVTGSAFFDLRTFPPDDKERFLRSVRKGLRVMPAWEGIVKPHEMESIWLYIGRVNGWPAAR